MFVTEYRSNLIHQAFLVSGLAVNFIAAAYLWFLHDSPRILLTEGIYVIILGFAHSAYLFGTSPGGGSKRINDRFEVNICIHVVLTFALIIVTGGSASPFKMYLPFAVALVSYAIGNILSVVTLIAISVAYTFIAYTGPTRGGLGMLIPHLAFFSLATWLGHALARNQNQANCKVAKTLLNLEDAVAAEQAFHEAGKALVSNIGLEETLQVILQYAIRLVDGSSGCIGTWDKLEAKGTYATIIGLPDLQDRSFDLNTGVFGQVAAHFEPMLIEDYRSCSYRLDLLEKYEVGSLIAIPLQFSGQLSGVLGIFNRSGDKPFGQQHLLLLQTFADLAASAINRAHLYQEVSTKSQQLAALLEISQQIASSFDQTDILNTVLTTAVSQSMAKSGFICLISDDGTEIQKAAAYSVPKVSGGDCFMPVSSNPIIQQMIASKEIMEFTASEKGELSGCLDGLEAQTVIIVPLVGRDKVVGALVCGKDNADRFTQSEKDFLVQLSLSGAIAIDNASLYQKTHRLAVRDPLTGLFNRRLLFQDLERECKLAMRMGSCWSFVMMDIDDFKIFNDQHGHQAGDYILRSFAQILRKELRETDLIYRYGGEEFCIILPGISKPDASKITDRIHDALSQEKLGITISVGLASFPEDSEIIDEIISLADSAMYRAKKAGKNSTSA